MVRAPNDAPDLHHTLCGHMFHVEHIRFSRYDALQHNGVSRETSLLADAKSTEYLPEKLIGRVLPSDQSNCCLGEA
jgi:hypothetical protein